MSWVTEWWKGTAQPTIVPAAHPLMDSPERMDSLARAFANAIAFHPSTRFTGLGSQPSDALLLHEANGWADIAGRQIGNRLSSLTLEVVAVRMAGGKEQELVLPTHELADLLRYPGGTHSMSQMLSLLGQYLPHIGQGYWLKVGAPGPSGRVNSLHVMLPQRIEPMFESGRVAQYLVTDGNGRQAPVPADDVIRFWRPDPETLYTARGYLGPQSIMADATKFAAATLRAHYQSNGTPDIVLESKEGATVPPPPGSELALRFNEAWRQAYHRIDGGARGLPAILPIGVVAHVLDAADKGQLVVVLDAGRDQLLAAYGVPKSLVGQTDDTGLGRANAETNQFVFDQHAVKPLADLIADALTTQLARPLYGPSIRVRFAEFVTRDKDFELKREAQDLQLGVRVINEVRANRGEPPKPWGDLPKGTFADAPYTGEVASTTPSPDNAAALGGDATPPRARGPAARAAGVGAGSSPVVLAEWKRTQLRERQFVPRFDLAMRKVLRAQQRDVMAQLDKAGLNRSGGARALTDAEVLEIVRRSLGPQRWEAVFKAQTDPVRKASMLASGQQALDLIDIDATFQFTPRVVAILQAQGLSFRERVSATTLKTLSEEITTALAEGAAAGEGVSERAKRIEIAIGDGFDIRRSHSKTIARTEMGKATQKAQTEGYRQSGIVEQKQWNTSRDDAVRDSHQIDGQIVALDDEFVLEDGARASEPMADSLPAEDVINCRCFVTPVIGETP
jgi:hypothetical protein